MADFGVARVQAETGVMTAETGTYRWMAPEVHLVLNMTMLMERKVSNIFILVHQYASLEKACPSCSS